MQTYQYDTAATGLGLGFILTFTLIGLAFGIFMIAAMWGLFAKAGQPGWAAIIPFYNTIVQLRVVGRPWWWVLLVFVPIVNVIVAIILCVDLAKSFGKGTGFGVATIFFPLVTIPMLAWGSARYVGPAALGGGQYPGQQQYQQQYQQPYPGQQYGAQQYPYQGQPQPGYPQQAPGQQYPGQQPPYPPQ